MRTSKALLTIGLVMLLAFGISACGGGDDDSDGVTCAAGTGLEDGECVVQSDGCGENTILEEGECRPAPEACAEGATFDEMTAECVPNSQVSCGPGTVEENGSCVAEEACQDGLAWDAEEERCRLQEGNCGEGTELDASSGQCIATGSQCAEGEVLDAGECVAKSSLCSGDTHFSEEVGRCVGSKVLTGSCSDPTMLAQDQLEEDTTLPAGNCYEVTEVLTLDSGVNLTVEAGVKMVFQQDTGMVVQSENSGLIVNGTEDNQVEFTGKQEEKGFWRGIWYKKTKNQDNSLKHAIIDLAGRDSWGDHGERASRFQVGEITRCVSASKTRRSKTPKASEWT